MEDADLRAQAIDHGLQGWRPADNTPKEAEIAATKADGLSAFAGLRAPTTTGCAAGPAPSEPGTSASTASETRVEPDGLKVAGLGVEALEAFGLDALKEELRRRGLKCGGTLHDRAERLWQARNTPSGEGVDRSLMAKKRTRDDNPPQNSAPPAPSSGRDGFKPMHQGPLLPGTERLPGQRKIKSTERGMEKLAENTAAWQRQQLEQTQADGDS